MFFKNMEEKRIEEFLKKEAKKITVSKQLLKDTLNKVDLDDVTKNENSGYKYQMDNKGRFKLIKSDFMKWNFKVVVPVVVVAAVAVVLLVGQPGDVTPDMFGNNQPAPEINLPQASGDVDQTVDAILAMAENEAAILAADDIDLDLVDLELQTLDDYSNIYDGI